MACAVLSAQGRQDDENAARAAAGIPPVFRVSVTARTAKALNYQHRSGATKIDFRGTELMAKARGEAKVESKQGYIEIEVEFDDLLPANRQGPEYLTYVLWAITPEGRTANLGEILLNGTKSKLDVTTDLQVFGLLVTAEPYYAVTRPSDLIVMENVVRADTKGKVEEIDAKYELLQRGQYERLSNPLALKLDRKLPLELYQARNAVQIARSVGAERFATETFNKAVTSLAQAEVYQARNAGTKSVTRSSREAVQTAEDARAIAVTRQEEAALAAERQDSADREARALSETDRVKREAESARLNAQANAERLARENDAQAAAASAEANRVRRENDARTAAAAADADRLKRDNDARAAAAVVDADRVRRDNDARELSAKNEADRLRLENDSRIAAAGAEADRLRRENDAQKAANQAALDDITRQKAQLEADKVELRSRLMTQFNLILQTRDTARGLIVNMSDVLFDTGKFTLQVAAREKLARIAGIISGHPGLTLEIEGHTDSVGTDEYNQRLSEQRGGAVREFLTQQGMSANAVTSKGFGESKPVASNDTASGRQQNRRVEIVVSGDIIGTEIGIPVAVR